MTRKKISFRYRFTEPRILRLRTKRREDRIRKSTIQKCSKSYFLAAMILIFLKKCKGLLSRVVASPLFYTIIFLFKLTLKKSSLKKDSGKVNLKQFSVLYLPNLLTPEFSYYQAGNNICRFYFFV